MPFPVSVQSGGSRWADFREVGLSVLSWTGSGTAAQVRGGPARGPQKGPLSTRHPSPKVRWSARCSAGPSWLVFHRTDLRAARKDSASEM